MFFNKLFCKVDKCHSVIIKCLKTITLMQQFLRNLCGPLGGLRAPGWEPWLQLYNVCCSTLICRKCSIFIPLDYIFIYCILFILFINIIIELLIIYGLCCFLFRVYIICQVLKYYINKIINDFTKIFLQYSKCGEYYTGVGMNICIPGLVATMGTL